MESWTLQSLRLVLCIKVCTGFVRLNTFPLAFPAFEVGFGQLQLWLNPHASLDCRCVAVLFFCARSCICSYWLIIICETLVLLDPLFPVVVEKSCIFRQTIFGCFGQQLLTIAHGPPAWLFVEVMLPPLGLHNAILLLAQRTLLLANITTMARCLACVSWHPCCTWLAWVVAFTAWNHADFWIRNVWPTELIEPKQLESWSLNSYGVGHNSPVGFATCHPIWLPFDSSIINWIKSITTTYAHRFQKHTPYSHRCVLTNSDLMHAFTSMSEYNLTKWFHGGCHSPVFWADWPDTANSPKSPSNANGLCCDVCPKIEIRDMLSRPEHLHVF